MVNKQIPLDDLELSEMVRWQYGTTGIEGFKWILILARKIICGMTITMT